MTVVTTGAKVSRTITTRSPFARVARVTFEACSGSGFAESREAQNSKVTAQVIKASLRKFNERPNRWKWCVRNMEFPLIANMSGAGNSPSLSLPSLPEYSIRRRLQSQKGTGSRGAITFMRAADNPSLRLSTVAGKEMRQIADFENRKSPTVVPSDE
jgi:hypothetical protein